MFETKSHPTTTRFPNSRPPLEIDHVFKPGSQNFECLVCSGQCLCIRCCPDSQPDEEEMHLFRKLRTFPCSPLFSRGEERRRDVALLEVKAMEFEGKLDRLKRHLINEGNAKVEVESLEKELQRREDQLRDATPSKRPTYMEYKMPASDTRKRKNQKARLVNDYQPSHGVKRVHTSDNSLKQARRSVPKRKCTWSW